TTNLPNPGQPNIVSIIMFPPKSIPICRPITVTVGIRAFLKACLVIYQKG
ncbi:unnamed protein product, partial [marine sediment metagenome]